MNIKWYKNKILGDFAESICINHFDALGYHIEYTGIEKSASMFTKYSNLSKTKSITSETIYRTIHKTPDLLISRLFNNHLESFFIEVKYRNTVEDFQQLENELLWQYRHEIWTNQIMEILNLNINEKEIWLNNTIPLNNNLLDKVKKDYRKKDFIKLPIIFYLVVKNTPRNENHIYCNFATFPKWWNVGDSNFNKNNINTYISNNKLNNYKNFNEVYKEEIEPALNSIFN